MVSESARAYFAPHVEVLDKKPLMRVAIRDVIGDGINHWQTMNEEDYYE